MLEYSEHQRQNWAQSKRIKIYESEAQLLEFIKSAKNSNTNKKMYFGIIPMNIAKKIDNDFGINIEDYNVSISENEVRKIFKDHGSENTEAPRGQRAITEDDFVNIPKIIQSPDCIILDKELYNEKPAIKFIKTINGKTTVLIWVSDRHKDLVVQTMYSGRNKSGALATPVAEQAANNTP